MRPLLHELGRAIRLTPLEIRTRWHAARLARHERLLHEHSAALETCMTDVRTFAGTTP